MESQIHFRKGLRLDLRSGRFDHDGNYVIERTITLQSPWADCNGRGWSWIDDTGRIGDSTEPHLRRFAIEPAAGGATRR